VSILKVNNLAISFGGLTALADFNLTLQAGELVGLIGPNGAGKTTVFNILTAVYPPDRGEIWLADRFGEVRNIVGRPPYQVTRLGVARTFQSSRLFKNLSVLDNVKIAFHFQVGYSSGAAVWRTSRFYREEAALHRQAMDLLDLVGLTGQATVVAGNLPYGDQRKLEIVRALATNPHLLLLDEPAAGMNPWETGALMELIALIKERFHLTILLIEHDMRLVMGICNRIVVLDYGRTIAEGTPDEIRNDVRVIQAYLGEEPNAGA
jgi:branched-chain amino acid transport system ATP-binding protein